MDLFGNADERDPVSRFVQLLWEKGTAFEAEVIEGLKIEYTDLSGVPLAEREARTEEAIARGDGLIYQGRIRAGGLLGQPDLLRRTGDGYVAGDIKSGSGEEGSSDLEDGKPKKHYAVQLALYTDILEQKSIASGRSPFVWDIHGQEIAYHLDGPLGPRTPQSIWEFYQQQLEVARRIIARTEEPRPAIGAPCKECHWRTACSKQAKRLDDLSLIPGLGRARRDSIVERLPTVAALAAADLSEFADGKGTVFSRIGWSMLEKFQENARLIKDPARGPYLKSPAVFPDTEFELFFDIETDPFRDLCYLHGFIERCGRDHATEKYVAFLASAPTDEEERAAFARALEYVTSRKPHALYFYSSYEKTWWCKLQERYPDVASAGDVEAVFSPDGAVDLYTEVVKKKTVWPANDQSIKTLAKYLGFEWRDTDPSGAESIEWYHRWVEGGDELVKQRILEYNEDDCRATRVLLDALRAMPVIGG
jgi:predicted RecB family nuclease